jgi:hypothetical protein
MMGKKEGKKSEPASPGASRRAASPGSVAEEAGHIEVALRAVRDGADIYERSMEGVLRDLSKLGLVDICEAMQAPKDGAKRQPYFGCILTPLGRKVLTETKLRRLGRNTLRKFAKVEG